MFVEGANSISFSGKVKDRHMIFGALAANLLRLKLWIFGRKELSSAACSFYVLYSFGFFGLRWASFGQLARRRQPSEQNLIGLLLAPRYVTIPFPLPAALIRPFMGPQHAYGQGQLTDQQGLGCRRLRRQLGALGGLCTGP
ncbi:hypothetical protein H0H92_002930, partial [Tricholoma furcatifolium]